MRSLCILAVFGRVSGITPHSKAWARDSVVQIESPGSALSSVSKGSSIDPILSHWRIEQPLGSIVELGKRFVFQTPAASTLRANYRPDLVGSNSSFNKDGHVS